VRAHTFNIPAAGTAFAVGIVLVLAATISMIEPASLTVGIKGDRLAVVARKAECPPIVWPYGCEWQAHSIVQKKSEAIRQGSREQSQQTDEKTLPKFVK